MDPGNQPIELVCLTQIEEMLIARVNPILQVTHARGGQYKYFGHTISFPQYISTISTSLPRLLADLDILVVRKFNAANKPYEFIVSRSNVLAALEFKISNDPYYKDVHLDLQALHALPLEPTDVSSLLHHATTPLTDAQRRFHKILDCLHPIHICSTCQESYPGIKMKLFHGSYTCSRYTREHHGHRFSLENNMDPRH